MRVYLKLALILFLLVPAGMCVSAETLRVSFSHSNTEPYTFIKNGKLAGGIIKSLMDEVGRRLGISMQYVELPTRRYETAIVKYAQADSACIMNPAWMQHPHALDWSIPLFNEEDWIMVRHDSGLQVNSFSDLAGKHLGTINGYVYAPKLQKRLQQNMIIRDDVRSLHQNILKLQFHRIDAFVDSNILIQYELKKSGLLQQFEKSPLIVSRHEIFCVLRRDAPVTIDRFNAVLGQMKQEGFIQYVLARYR